MSYENNNNKHVAVAATAAILNNGVDKLFNPNCLQIIPIKRSILFAIAGEKKNAKKKLGKYMLI